MRRNQKQQAENRSTSPFGQQSQDQSQQPRKEKTKADLARIRQQMMKSMFKDRKAGLQKLSGIKKEESAGHGTLELANHSAGIYTQRVETEHSREKQKNLTTEFKNQDLMARLASGGKAMVDKKAMRKLTIKNYEKLPEIMKKKQEAK